MKTVARVFKIGGNNLNKPLGVRAKSIIGVDDMYITETYSQHGKNFSTVIPGLLYDRYYKIPDPEGNKTRKN
jgi:hypothetical protein